LNKEANKFTKEEAQRRMNSSCLCAADTAFSLSSQGLATRLDSSGHSVQDRH